MGGGGPGAGLRGQRRARRLSGDPPRRPPGAGRPHERAGPLGPGCVQGRRRRQRARGQRRSAAAAARLAAPRRGTTCSCGRPQCPGGDAHAGRTETSLMLAIDPGAVHLELAEAGRTEPIGALLPTSARRGGAAGIVQRRAGRPRWCECRRGPCPPRPTRDGPHGSRVVALARTVSPVAVVTGAARGMGAATVDALVGVRLAGRGGRSRRGRPGARLPPGLDGRARGAGRAPRRRRAAARG